jgi:hypothetical protein
MDLEVYKEEEDHFDDGEPEDIDDDACNAEANLRL